MSDDARRVLDLLEQRKITAAAAHELLRALALMPKAEDPTGEPQPTEPAGAAGPAGPRSEPAKPRYLRVSVYRTGKEGRRDKDVNIRVPMAIVRSGIRLGALIPGFARERVSARLRERGIDVDLTKIDPAMIESLIKDLGEVNIDVNGGEEQVRITCE
jgi:hypothetical protein